jgi:hypothetical protein
MSDNIKPGDKVTWNSMGGEVHGEVEKVLTKPTTVPGTHHTAKASEDDPQYLVKSDKTGKEAAHKAGALHKDSSEGKEKSE